MVTHFHEVDGRRVLKFASTVGSHGVDGVCGAYDSGGSCHCPTMIKISKCDGDGDGKTVCALRTMQAEIRVSISAENQRGKNKSSHDTG